MREYILKGTDFLQESPFYSKYVKNMNFMKTRVAFKKRKNNTNPIRVKLIDIKMHVPCKF